MRTPTAALACLIALLLLPVAPAAAQDAAPDAPAPNEELDTLRDAFNRLYESLSNQAQLARSVQPTQPPMIAGMYEADKLVVRALREQFAAYNVTHLGDETGIMHELQLSIWLQDDDRVDALFTSLALMHGDTPDIGRARAQYFLDRKDYPRADASYDALVQQFPDEVEILVDYARQLKERNYYARAIVLLERLDVDFATYPQVAALLTDSYFAEQRFDEAKAIIDQLAEAGGGLPVELTDAARVNADQIAEYVELWSTEQAIRAAETEADDLPRIDIITTRGTITCELFENEAPNTVANFISLVEDSFYAGTAFHRVLKNFMSQGGDPNTKLDGTGTPGEGHPGYYIKDEVDGENYRRHFTGSLSMAKSPQPNTGGSQFFITHTSTPWLNGQHTVFGRVLEGVNVARSLEESDRIQIIRIIRKRDHPYVAIKLPLSQLDPSITPIQIGDSVQGALPMTPAGSNNPPAIPPAGGPGGGAN